MCIYIYIITILVHYLNTILCYTVIVCYIMPGAPIALPTGAAADAAGLECRV